jgi:hypothetical protein
MEAVEPSLVGIPMTHVLLLGAGTIGRMIATLLIQSGDYVVKIGDSDPESLKRLHAKFGVETIVLDASNEEQLRSALKGMKAVISALTFSLNPTVARAALAEGVSYFDLTEDVATTSAVRELAASAKPGQIFMPQCGLAPGFVGIAANHLAKKFEKMAFVGTCAWFFFAVNLAKIPMSWSLGLISKSSLLLNLLLLPGVAAGMLAGRLLLGKIPQGAFDSLMIVMALASAVRLILS